MTFRHCDAQQHTGRGWVPNPEVKVRILRPVLQTHQGQIFSKGEIHSYPIIYWRTSKAVCKENGRTSCICSSMVSLTMSLRAELTHPGELGLQSDVFCGWHLQLHCRQRTSSLLPLRRWITVVNHITVNRHAFKVGSFQPRESCQVTNSHAYKLWPVSPADGDIMPLERERDQAKAIMTLQFNAYSSQLKCEVWTPPQFWINQWCYIIRD